MLPNELATNPLFVGLSADHLAVLAPLFTRLSLQAGEVLFAQGDRAEKAYVIEAGHIGLRFRPEDGGWITIATLNEPGNVFGWSAVLGRSRYNSAAVCLTEVQALCALGADLRKALQAHPALNILLGRMTLSVAQRPVSDPQSLTRLLHQEMTHAQL